MPTVTQGLLLVRLTTHTSQAQLPACSQQSPVRLAASRAQVPTGRISCMPCLKLAHGVQQLSLDFCNL